MAFIPFPNTAKVAVECSLFGQQVVNTLYFKRDVPVDVVGLSAIVEYVNLWFVEGLLPLLSADLVMGRVTGTDLTQGSGIQIVDTSSQGEVGGNITDAPLDNKSCIVVSFRTARSGRSYRGRNYISGLRNSNRVTANTFSPAFMSAIAVTYNTLLLLNGTTPSLDWRWVVASRFENNVERAVGATEPILQTQITDGVIKSQRNRMPGNGS